MFSFLEMKKTSPTYSTFDYIGYSFRTNHMNLDIFDAIVCLAKPTLVVQDGFTLIAEVDAPRKFLELLQNKVSPHRAQYWANMVEITELAPEVDIERAEITATTLAKMWERSLIEAKSAHISPVRIVRDDIEGELFVTIGTYLEER